MNKEYTIKQMAETRWLYTFTETNSIGENIVIELMKCENSGSNNSLPNLWKQKGHTDRVLETYWSIETYATDTEGACWGRYNPQTKLSEDGKRAVINFDWMFEATEENKQKLIDEVYRLASSTKGETATETKMRKIKEFAKEHNVELLTVIPEGWKRMNAMIAPTGTDYITNSLSFKDKNRRKALVIL